MGREEKETDCRQEKKLKNRKDKKGRERALNDKPCNVVRCGGSGSIISKFCVHR